MTTTSEAAPALSSSAPRLPRLGVVAALVRRDYLVGTSYRAPFVLEFLFGFINILIYLFISRTFDDVTNERLAGAPTYFAFAASGVALNVVIQAAAARIGQRVREEQLTGALELLVAQPITVTELSFGFAGFHFLFAMVRVVVYLLVADVWLGLGLHDPDWLGFVIVLAAAGIAMMAIGIALAAVVVLLKRAELLVGLVTLALGLAGGAFFPTSVLPRWLEPVANVLPTTFAFDGVRAALFRGEDWAGSALALLAFGAVGLPVAVAVFGLALDLARRRGSLSTP